MESLDLQTSAKCVEETVADNSLFTGENCTFDIECLSNMCYNNKCNAAVVGNSCVAGQCEAGLYCNEMHVCVAQMPIGTRQCTSDYQCVNNAGCDLDSLKVGICRRYFTAEAGSRVACGSTLGDVNILCQSGTAVVDTFSPGYCVCVEAPTSLASLPT